MNKKQFSACILLCLVSLCGRAYGETVLSFTLQGGLASNDFEFSGGEFSSIIDPGVTQPNGQLTDLQFETFFDGIPDIGSGAVISMSGLLKTGTTVTFGNIVTQQFSGGSFSIFDDMDNLLLGGTIASSSLVGSTAGGNATISNSDPVTFTSGSLLSLVDPNSGAFSLAMDDVRTGGALGLRGSSTGTMDGQLQDFSARLTGQFEAAVAVPEPSSVVLLVLFGLVAVGKSRRRSSEHQTRQRRGRAFGNKLVLSLSSIVICACLPSMSTAGTIIKINLNGFTDTSPDVVYEAGVLSAKANPNGKIGDHLTSIEYADFLALTHTDILKTASFSMGGVQAHNSTHVFGTDFFQETTGGFFKLFDDLDGLLLHGEFDEGLISGSSTSSTGGFITSTPFRFVAGSLLNTVAPDNASFSLAFTGITSLDGNHLSVTGPGPGTMSLDNFSADATGLIGANQVPEPFTSASFSLLGVLGIVELGRRRRRRSATSAASL
jgi:hypothetical protein